MRKEREVGGMVGLERTVVPLVGTEEFHIQSDVVVFSFIMFFGVVKAFTSLISGVLADQYTRKKVLVLGWLIGVSAPFYLLMGRSYCGGFDVCIEYCGVDTNEGKPLRYMVYYRLKQRLKKTFLRCTR